MATFSKIASVTVGSGGSSSIDFTSIPSTYTDLMIKASLRTSAGTSYGVGYLKINGSGDNQSQRRLYGDGSGTGTDGQSNATYVPLALINGAGSTSNTFGSVDIYFSNYLSNNAKSFYCDSVGENNATTIYMQILAGLWSPSTQAPITSISLIAGDFVQHSTATLYGIKNS